MSEQPEADEVRAEQPDLFGDSAAVRIQRSRRAQLRVLLGGLPNEERLALRSFLRTTPELELGLTVLWGRIVRRKNVLHASYMADANRALRQRERADALEAEAADKRKGGDEQGARMSEVLARELRATAQADDLRANELLLRMDEQERKVIDSLREHRPLGPARVVVELLGADDGRPGMFGAPPADNYERLSSPHDQELLDEFGGTTEEPAAAADEPTAAAPDDPQ